MKYYRKLYRSGVYSIVLFLKLFCRIENFQIKFGGESSNHSRFYALNKKVVIYAIKKKLVTYTELVAQA